MYFQRAKVIYIAHLAAENRMIISHGVLFEIPIDAHVLPAGAAVIAVSTIHPLNTGSQVGCACGDRASEPLIAACRTYAVSRGNGASKQPFVGRGYRLAFASC